VKMDESGRLTSVMKFEFEGEKVSYERRSTTTELFMKHVHDHDVHGAHQHYFMLKSSSRRSFLPTDLHWTYPILVVFIDI
jgi:hypothetical protein